MKDTNITTSVTMKLSAKTIERVNRIKQNTQETNRTRICVFGIELLDYLITNVNKGGKITITFEDGSVETIKIIGI